MKRTFLTFSSRDDLAELGHALAALARVVGGVRQVAREDDEVGLLRERIDRGDGLGQRALASGFGGPSNPQCVSDSCTKQKSSAAGALAIARQRRSRTPRPRRRCPPAEELPADLDVFIVSPWSTVEVKSSARRRRYRRPTREFPGIKCRCRSADGQEYMRLPRRRTPKAGGIRLSLDEPAGPSVSSASFAAPGRGLQLRALAHAR